MLLPCILALLLPSFHTALPDDARLQGWEADLAALTQGLQAKHKNPFTIVSKEEFLQRAEQLKERLPKLKDHEILVEFMKLSALLGDGHTMMGPTRQAKPWGRYPFAPLWVKDGLVIVASSEEQKELLRCKIVGVGNCSLEEVERRLGAMVGHDNEYARKESVPRWIVVPEALAGLGIIADMHKAEFMLEDQAGKRRTVTLAPLPATFRGPFHIDAALQKPDLPVWQKLQRERFGLKWLADSKTLYCWYDACANQPNKTVAAWCAEVLQALEENKAERLVLDLRRNGGGNSILINPLMNGLAKREAFRKPGSILVLMSRNTFSSAMMNALQFRQRLQAVLLGSPTGGSPNHFGEVRTFPLPHCKWQVQYSTKLFRMTNDNAKTVKPDIEVEATAEDLFAGKDAVLDAALSYKPKR